MAGDLFLNSLQEIAECDAPEVLIESLYEASYCLLENISRMAAIVHRLDELGAKVEFDHALLPYIRMVSRGELLGQCLVAVCGDPALLEQATKAPLEVQKRMADVDFFDVVMPSGEVAELLLLELTKKQILQVFNNGKIRTLDEQREYLKKSATRSAMTRARLQPQASSGDDLEDAIAAFRVWQSKYGHLPAVKPIVEAARVLLDSKPKLHEPPKRTKAG
jgi:hypothetical protein